MKGNTFSSRMFAFLFVVILGLCYCSKESSQSVLGQPHLFGPSEALMTTVVNLHCDLQIYPKNETILLELFKKGNRDKVLGQYTLAGKTATFPMVIKKTHEGDLECVAKAQNNSKIEPTVSQAHYLKVVEPVEDAKIEVRSGSLKFFEGRTLELYCNPTAGNYVSYKWLLNGRIVSESSLSNHLLINRTTSEDSGTYMCVATNQFNKTEIFTANSSEVEIMVKDVVSKPNISFTVLKDSHGYYAMVSCQSTKGALPVTFSLYNGTELFASMTAGKRNATFKVPLRSQHLGLLQCHANNGDRDEYSQQISVEVVPVGGPVTMQYDYDIGENYAVIGLKFYCKAVKGSFPRYQWFLNRTLLHDQGSFYRVVHQPPEQSILLLSVGRSSAGTYRCEVSDSFDHTNVISSKSRYIDKKALNRLPDLVVAIVFGCFTVLILLVSFCCFVGVVFRRKQYGEKSLLEMQRVVTVYEDKLNLSEYDEDADLMNTARDTEFDEASEASVDEWPQIEEEKKTLEDEPAEEP